MPRYLRGWASCGLLLALWGCTDAGTTGLTPGAPGAATPPPASAAASSLTLTPDTLILNAPYTYSGFDHTGISNSTALANPAAGYPIRGQFVGRFGANGEQEASASELIWSSSNPEIVPVDPDGTVHSLDIGTYGTVIITARLRSNPAVTATATVILKNDGKLALEVM